MPAPAAALGANDLALIFYELATNASKYGSLSNEGGYATFTWATEADCVLSEWTESGACGVDLPRPRILARS